MNWKEFKDKVESEGVTDEMELWYIDVSGGSIDVGGIDVSYDEELGFSVG